MAQTDGTGFHIVIERRFDASPETVFAQWLDAEALKDWFSPEGFTGMKAEADAQPGGTWRVVYRSPDGVDIAETGTYTVIDRPTRLELTLTQDLPGGVRDTRIVVTFAPDGDGTVMRFSQAGLVSAAQRDGMADGWGTCFDRLRNRLGEAELRAEFETWFAASERKDLDASMERIAEDVISYEHSAPLEVRNIAGVRAECARGFRLAGPEFRWDVPDHAIIVRGDIAVAWGLNRMATRENGTVVNEMWSRGTRVFQRRDGRWLMIHQHVSFPFDPETGSARLDLTPGG